MHSPHVPHLVLQVSLTGTEHGLWGTLPGKTQTPGPLRYTILVGIFPRLGPFHGYPGDVKVVATFEGPHMYTTSVEDLGMMGRVVAAT